MFTKINCANYKHLLYNKIAQLDLIPTVLVRLFSKTKVILTNTDNYSYGL